MKKFILCIIISCLFSSQQVLHAQETTSIDIKIKDVAHNNMVLAENSDIHFWNVSNIGMQGSNHDFYTLETSKAIAFHSTSINYLPTTDNAKAKKPSNSAGFVPPNNADLMELQKPCVPFIIAIFSILVIVIVFIVVRRIKTNTLKLF